MQEKVKKFWYDISQKKLTISSAALILGATYLVSNILGMLREALIAAKFGGTMVGGVHLTDIFYASFRIPDLIFNLLVLGAVSSAFIPVFVDYLTEDKKEESNLVASNFMNFLLVGTIIFGVVVYVLAWKLVPLLLPGFFLGGNKFNLQTYATTVTAVRLMILSPIFFAVGSVFGAILNSNKRFFSFAFAPVVYNLSIIVGILVFSKYSAQPLYGLTAGVIMGALLQMLIQLPETLMTGWRWRPTLALRKFELPKIIRLMIPRTLAIGVGQINIVVDTIVASFFVAIGGITVINFANDIQTLPTVIFGIAIATAVFPSLAELVSKKEKKEFTRVFSESARKILYFMIPATIGIIVLRAQIVRLIFGLGDFSWQSTYWTTKSLLYFSIGLVAQGLIPLLIRAFYSLKDTRTPLYIAILVMITNVVLSVTLPFLFPHALGVAGIALAFSIAGWVNAVLLFIFLHKKIGALDRDNKIFASTSRLLIASIIMGIIVHYSLYLFAMFTQTNTVVGLGLQTIGATAVGAVTYYLLTHMMKVEETNLIFKRTL